jgi:hypothetical protein
MSNRSFRRTRAPGVAVLALAAAALAGCGGAAAAGSHSHPAVTSAAATAAERAAVPAPATKVPATKAPAPAAPKVLLSLSGSGIANSPPFPVAAETLTVHYSYSCASFGSSGNFIADLQSGNQRASARMTSRSLTRWAAVGRPRPRSTHRTPAATTTWQSTPSATGTSSCGAASSLRARP